MARIATLLSHYWQSNDPDEIVEANMRDWLDVLEHLPETAIQKACVSWLSRPVGKKPTPGEIAALARAAMPASPAIRLVQMESQPVGRISKERAREIMAEVGFRVKWFGDGQDTGQG